MTKRKINQKDIADSLNLSVATVSKALRGDYSDINNETRVRVLNMASQMGYDTGTRLRQKLDFELEQETCQVGVFILRKSHEWQHTSYFAGMSEKCAKMNVSLILHYVNEENCRDILDPAHQPPALRDGQLHGLILVNHWPEAIADVLSRKIPCVSILSEYQNIDTIGIDENRGISMLMDHLYRQEHRKIGYFGLNGKITYSRNRFSMYMNSLYRLGLTFDPTAVVEIESSTLEDKEFDIDRQIATAIDRINNQGVCAWVCASDWVGYLLCRGLLNRGFRVPTDVSVTGFDNSEDNTLGCPKLTSISVPALRVGAEALRRLINRIRHPNSPSLRVMLPCKFFEAQTTGPAPEDDTPGSILK